MVCGCSYCFVLFATSKNDKLLDGVHLFVVGGRRRGPMFTLKVKDLDGALSVWWGEYGVMSKPLKAGRRYMYSFFLVSILKVFDSHCFGGCFSLFIYSSRPFCGPFVIGPGVKWCVAWYVSLSMAGWYMYICMCMQSSAFLTEYRSSQHKFYVEYYCKCKLKASTWKHKHKLEIFQNAIQKIPMSSVLLCFLQSPLYKYMYM